MNKIVTARGLGIHEMGSYVKPFTENQLSHIFSLSLVVMFLSAFMNNVGALALMLPVALKTSVDRQRSPTILLLPMAFACILGGMMTMIGQSLTPLSLA